MGDRANIKMKSRGHTLYVYTHWEGYRWPSLLQVALRGCRSRWEDPQYAQRFIITSMCPHDPEDDTGYGVSGWLGDGDDNVTEVDFDTGQVSNKNGSWSFPDFVNLAIEDEE